jgi:LacI family transcriptional regulator, galactose operon repressor
MAATTLTEVARHAGVSLATASRVLNGSARTPAQAIAARVRSAARELGYVPNAQAQALARSATGLIGLVVHDIADPYFSAITRGAQRYAWARRNQVLLVGAERSEQAELAAIAAFVAYRTQAVILAGSRRDQPDERLARELGRYVTNGGRVVTLGPSTIPGARHLEVGNRTGARRLADALLARDIRDFAILAGPPELNTARHRVEGYLDALSHAGLQPLAVINGDFTSQGGYASALAYWKQFGPRLASDRVCLLAVNDVMALGAITAIRSIGLSVPNDIQVAGFDDIPTLRDFAPGLTTFRLPLEQMGELAAEMALSPEVGSTVAVTGEVVLRESAG